MNLQSCELAVDHIMAGPLDKNQRAESPYLYRLDSLLSNQGNFGTQMNHLDSAVGSIER
jgi:hypothetical protein